MQKSDAAHKKSGSGWLRLLPGRGPTAPWAVLLLVVISSLIFVLFTFRDYGFTVDELNGYRRAQNVYRFLESFGANSEGVSQFSVYSFYGAMPDVVGMVLQNMFPSLELDARHLVSGLFGTVGVYYCGRLASRFSDLWTGTLAALLLLLCTFWTGYSFINLKDIPFAASMLGALYSAMRILDPGNDRPVPSYLMLAVWTGALATCKLTGILILGVFVAVLYGFSILEGKFLQVGTLVKRVLLAFVSGFLGIAAFSLLFWPQIYFYSPAQLYEVVVAFINFPAWQGKVLLSGELYNYDQIPRSYLITYLVISMPLAIWPLYFAGGVLAILNRNWRILAIALLAPLILVIQAASHSVVYNGARHLIFVIPFLMITAAYGATSLAAINTAGRLAAAAIVAVFAAVSVYNTVTLYPYQYSAYNVLVGGLSGAQGRYYVDVWRSADREALRSVPTSLNGIPVSVFSCGSILNMVGMAGIQAARRPDTANYVVAQPRGCPPGNFRGFHPIYEVRRGDIVFATVMERL